MKNKITLILSFLFLNSALLADQRPNILWITSEDNGPDLGAYGLDYAHTTALDNLAEESAIYTNAFATAGVCAPARSTIITGMYPPALGSQHMRSRAELPSGIKFYSHHLRGAGSVSYTHLTLPTIYSV